MFSELLYARNALIRGSFLFLFLTLVFFTVPTSLQNVRGVVVLLPSEEGKTITELAMDRIRTDLAPADVQLVTSSPLDPFTTKATLALVLAFAFAFPYFLLEFFLFIRPALYPRERKALARILILSLVLFVAGAVFAYTVVIPLIFSALFTYLPNDIAPLYNIRELISLVTGLMFSISLIFLLPVCMILLTQSRLIPSVFWLTYAKHAILLVLLLSAIITPDGSGVSMVLLALPICFLYGAGYMGSRFSARSSSL